MLSPVNGVTDQYLDDLDRIQSSLNDAQRRLSSGVRVGKPSDDPSAIARIMETLAGIAGRTQLQSNLHELQTELAAGDAALDQAVKAVEQAISLGAQASSALDAPQAAILAEQVKGIQERLVALSRATAGGRYIFSGDLDQQPLYEFDASQPDGVRMTATATSTRAVAGAGGESLWTSRSAHEIFDPREADGSPAGGNVFAALHSLLTALKNNDPTAAAQAVDSLKAADEHLNQQLGFYGIAESRLTDALDDVAKSLVADQRSLSELRDADVVAAAAQLSQAALEQQAALSAGAKLARMSLFDYLA